MTREHIVGNIIWLASYPKSGNTWVRAFLASYIQDDVNVSMDDLNMFAIGEMDRVPYDECFDKERQASMPKMGAGQERMEVHQYLANLDQGNPVVKTHTNFRTLSGDIAFNLSVTKSAVYIVRNPLDMVVSLADHYGMTIDHAIGAIGAGDFAIGKTETTVEQFLGRWSDHVVNWLTVPNVPKMVMRYEDMLRDPARAFSELIAFFKFEHDEAKLQAAVEATSFSNLKKKEQEQGFKEKSPNSEQFFRAGTFGGWRDVLSEKQVSRVLAANGAVMKKLGYITDNGAIRF